VAAAAVIDEGPVAGGGSFAYLTVNSIAHLFINVKHFISEF